MSKSDTLLMIAASLLLMFVNWLAFHDFREPHTVRDWLMLFASVLVLIEFARAQAGRHRQSSATRQS